MSIASYDEHIALLRTLRAPGNAPAREPGTATRIAAWAVEIWEALSDVERAAYTKEYALTFPEPGPGVNGASGTAVARPFIEVVGDGWLGEFTRLMAGAGMRCAPQLFFGAALAYLSVAIAARARIPWGVKPLYPNLYVLLVAPSGAGKGAAVYHAQQATLPMGVNLLPNEGTHQGYAEHLRLRWLDTGTIADGLIIAEEFQVLLSDEAHKRETSHWLTQWYEIGEGPWSRALRSQSSYYFENPRVGLLGGITPVGMREISERVVKEGFLGRIMFFDMTSDELMTLWGESDPVVRVEMVEVLRGSLSAVRERMDTLGGEIRVTPAGYAAHDRWYKGALKEEFLAAGEAMRVMLSRKQATVRKLAGIAAVVDGDGTIGEREMDWAVGIADWTMGAAARVLGMLGVMKAGAVEADTLALVQAQQRVPIGTKEIVKGLRARHGSDAVRRAVKALAETGDIVNEVVLGQRDVMWRVR